MSGDPYLDPRSGVFRNRLGLTDRTALAIAEKQFSAQRTNQLKRRRIVGQYDLDHLRAFHWTIFQDVYPTGGRERGLWPWPSGLAELPRSRPSG